MEERKIGEIFEHTGEWYQCVLGHDCKNCAFIKVSCSDDYSIGYCVADAREDNKDVIFKKLKKVGEPYTTSMGKTIQNYLLETAVSVFPKDVFTIILNEQRVIAIEIKETKEDMEENKTTFPKENNVLIETIHAYVSGKISDKELIKLIKEMPDEYPYNKDNLKPFDLEAAKAGKPVCTRDGRKARIICFDANIMPGNKNILALIRKDTGSEYVEYYTSNGKFSDSKDDINDLMMLPEKKSVWVNIDKGDSGKITISSPYSTKEEAIHHDNETTIDTIKIEWEE